VYHCERIHLSCIGPFESFMITTVKTDDDTCGVPKHVALLITYLVHLKLGLWTKL